MKRSFNYGVVIILIALVVGTIAFFVARSHKAQHSRDALIDNLPELEWVRSELDLSDDQFEKFRELHVAYRPECVEMCRRIRSAHDRLNLASSGRDGMTPELEQAIEDHARIHVECQKAMLEHLYETADVLDDHQAEHYLKVTLPFALDFSHSEPGGEHGK